MTHTPGHWYAAEVEGGLEIRRMRSEGDEQTEEVIADIRFGDTQPEHECRENARLLAAALPLLADLKTRAGNLETTADYLQRCVDAGMKHPGFNKADTMSLQTIIDGLRECGASAWAAIAKARPVTA